jgi:hypothetical protein
MNLKEKMMETMMGSMSAEEKKKMMNSMMESFFSSMSAEEKQDMMKTMMPNMMEMMKGSGGMMGMMSSMMGGRSPMKDMASCCDDSGEESHEDFNPMEMCKQMMSSMRQSSDIATFATPEIRNLFEEWVRQIEEEIEQYITKNATSDPEIIASHFKISKESAIYFLSRLAQKGKISMNVQKMSLS